MKNTLDDYGYDMHGNIVAGLKTKAGVNYTLDDGGKRLTEFRDRVNNPKPYNYHECPKCGHRTAIYGNVKPYTWNTPDDRQALAEKLHEVGEWDQYFIYASGVPTGFGFYMNFAYWLLVEKPDRFCWLVDRYLEERK